MAAQRFVSDTFWTDEYTELLTSKEKLMYLYLFTNPGTTQCGLYRLSIPTMELHTGISQHEILTFLEKLHSEKKVFFEAGMIFIPNMAKYQRGRGVFFETHVQKIAHLYASNGNVAISAFFRHFDSTLQAPMEHLIRSTGEGEGKGVGIGEED